MKGRWWPWLLLVLALVPALLISKPQHPLDVAPTQNVSVAIFSNPDTLDPALATTASDWAVVSNLFDPLFRFTSSGTVVPDLVTGYSMRQDTLTLHIDPVPLAGGGHLTAAVAAAALARPLWKQVQSPVAAALLSPVVGADAVIRGTTPFISGISVVNSTTMTITLKHRVTRSFLKGLANPALSIVPASDLLRGGPDWQLSNLYGTGGYRLTDWLPNGSLTFRRVVRRGPAEITLTVYPSFAEAMMSFQNQALNFVPVSPSQLGRVPRRLLSRIRAMPVPGDLFLVYRSGAHHISAYPNISIRRWISASFRGRVGDLGGHWPSSIPKGRAMTIYVNQDLPEAVQLADTLARMRPSRVTVQQVSLTQLTSLAQQNKMAAYIGQVDLFKSGGTMVPLAPLRVLWMADPGVHLAVYANGALNWHSLTNRR